MRSQRLAIVLAATLCGLYTFAAAQSTPPTAPPTAAQASAPRPSSGNRAAGPQKLDVLQSRLDRWVMQGGDDPDFTLQQMADEAAANDTERRVLALARGLVYAMAGRRPGTEQSIAQLRALAPSEPLAVADAELLRAVLADARGEMAPVAEAAQAALRVYEQQCPGRTGCDHRSAWRARSLLSRHDERRGQLATAREHAQAAVELARTAGDLHRQAWSLAQVADLTSLQGDGAQAQRLLGQAQRLARSEGSALLLARVRVFESRQHSRHGDPASARRAAESGLVLARQAGSMRLQAVHLINLSDLAVKAGQPQAALQAVHQALPLVQRMGLARSERVLTHNAALARIALGQSQAARQTLQQLLAAHQASGAMADEAEALREFADAFAAAGDPKAALELYHQERQLAARIMASNRDTALAELRARFDREAQQRQLQQLGRESSLISAQLSNRATLQKVWIATAFVLLLAAALVALLYRRVRAINRSLAHNHAFLRAQSQRDPLTGLANRRGLLEAAQQRGVDQQFSGALLLVDIDHFKHVNDGHGHATGDVVLVEVARRLSEVVREGDVVARWGGEEFLIYMPGVGATTAPSQVQALAERVLLAVGGQAVALPRPAAGDADGSPALRVTVSLGYGCFPLPPARLPLSLERAINLADMALYTAKGQGRNRAIGVAAVRADDDEGLRAAEADFDRAWHEGRLTLQRSLGPAEPAAPPARATAAAPVAAAQLP